MPKVPNAGMSVGVWGAIAYQGPLCLVFLDGNMDSQQHMKVLRKNWVKGCDKYNLLPRDTLLMQDNTSWHKSKATLKFLAKQRIKPLKDWPPLSSDLNPHRESLGMDQESAWQDHHAIRPAIVEGRVDEEDSSFVALSPKALDPQLVQRHEEEDTEYQRVDQGMNGE